MDPSFDFAELWAEVAIMPVLLGAGGLLRSSGHGVATTDVEDRR